MRNLTCLLLTAASLAGAEIAAPWSNGFDGRKRPEIIRWGSAGVFLAPENGKTVIKLDGSKARRVDVVMKGVPVDPKKKFRLEFEAWSVGPDTVEENPQIEVIALDPARAAKGKPLPGWRLSFRDASGKEVAREVNPFWTAIVSRRKTVYSETFYPPPGSASLEVIFSNYANPDNTVFIGSMKLETPDEGSLSVNPELKYGKFNYSGYNYGKNVRIVPEGEGKFVFDNETGWALLDSIPVEPGKEYTLEVEMADRGERNGRAGLWFMDEKGRKNGELKQVLGFSGAKPVKKSLQFIVPENTFYLRPLVGWGVIHSFKLNETGK